MSRGPTGPLFLFLFYNLDTIEDFFGRVSRRDISVAVIESARAPQTVVCRMSGKRGFGIINGIREVAESFAVSAGEERLQEGLDSRVIDSIDFKVHKVRAFCLSLASATSSRTRRRRLVASCL